ncbi:YacP-like NYN domain protein [bacterium BMS3Abin03]|nr:YacP-like NYN domain protein [bacterium BMS3Abin03]
MLQYIIDGNNLIGKIPSLHRLQGKDKQSSREKLAYLIDNYFHNKKAKVTLHFDGFMKEPIKITNAKIIYSDNHTADEEIKDQIGAAKNRKNIILISSDNNLKEFARVCSCRVISSEDFNKKIFSSNENNEEKIIEQMTRNNDEFKHLFGVDE